VSFTDVAAITENVRPSVERSIRKPVSLLELSRHLRLSFPLFPTGEAVKLVGAAGVADGIGVGVGRGVGVGVGVEAGCVVAVAVFE
jgi:hypothetical protein